MYWEVKIVSPLSFAISSEIPLINEWRDLVRDCEMMSGSPYLNRREFSTRL